MAVLRLHYFASIRKSHKQKTERKQFSAVAFTFQGPFNIEACFALFN